MILTTKMMFIFFARSFVIGKRFNVGSFKYLTVSTVENHFCNFKFERQLDNSAQNKYEDFYFKLRY